MSQSASTYYTTDSRHHSGKRFDSSSQEQAMDNRMPAFHRAQSEGQRPSQVGISLSLS